MNVPHFSAYHLIYEEGTPLAKRKAAGKIKPVSEESSEEFFISLIDCLGNAGYLHYEISNFARAGCISKHNSSYWNGSKYLGIGPSAHSFNGKSRQWNIASMNRYQSGIEAGMPDIEKEILDENTKYNEYIITGLRTMWGIRIDRIETEYGREKKRFCLDRSLALDGHLAQRKAQNWNKKCNQIHTIAYCLISCSLVRISRAKRF